MTTLDRILMCLVTRPMCQKELMAELGKSKSAICTAMTKLIKMEQIHISSTVKTRNVKTSFYSLGKGDGSEPKNSIIADIESKFEHRMVRLPFFHERVFN